MGTVYSGHPTATTLFNTLRVLSYVSYAGDLVGIHDLFTGKRTDV